LVGIEKKRNCLVTRFSISQIYPIDTHQGHFCLVLASLSTCDILSHWYYDEYLYVFWFAVSVFKWKFLVPAIAAILSCYLIYSYLSTYWNYVPSVSFMDGRWLHSDALLMLLERTSLSCCRVQPGPYVQDLSLTSSV
jgi:hypothetical protein